MSKSNQNRVTIPKWMREKSAIKEGEQYYLIYIANNEILISNEPVGKVIGQIRFDPKGRFFFPKNIEKLYCTDKMLMYSEEEKIGLLFLDRGA